MDYTINIKIDGADHELTLDARTTVLDALREHLGNTSPKKGCDHGQCGSCTVLIDGRRQLACLSLAVAHDGTEILTAAGITEGGKLHQLQQAFITHDGFQCGYCTPGQICSVIGMLDEAARGHPSHVTEDLDGVIELDDAEIRERLSGNLCRCGAYTGILDAVKEVRGQ